MPAEKFMVEAEKVRADFAQKQTKIAARADLSQGAKMAALAKAALAARAAMASIEASSKSTEETRKKQLSAQLFGTEGVKTSLDPVSMSMSARDAGDRASKITTPQEAESVLRRAQDTGDELLQLGVGSALDAARFGQGEGEHVGGGTWPCI